MAEAIKLKFGVSEDSTSDIQNGLQSIISKLNESNALKVKIGVDTSNSNEWASQINGALSNASGITAQVSTLTLGTNAIANLQAQINGILAGVTTTGNTNVNVNAGGVQQTTQEVNNLNNALQNTSQQANNVSDSMNNMGTNSAASLTDVVSALSNVENASEASINQLTSVLNLLNQMKKALSNNSNLSGTDEYNALANQVQVIEQALVGISDDGSNLDNVMNNLTGTIRTARTALAEFNLEATDSNTNSIKKLESALTSAQNLLKNNSSWAGTSEYDNLVTQVEQLQTALAKLNTGEEPSILRALLNVGSNSTTAAQAVDELQTSMTRLKAVMSQVDNEGTSMQKIVTTYQQLQTLMSSNSGMANTAAYAEVANIAERLKQVIDDVASGSKTMGDALADAFGDLGTTGKQAIEQAETSMDNFKTATEEAQRAANAATEETTTGMSKADQAIQAAKNSIKKMEDAQKSFKNLGTGDTKAEYEKIATYIEAMRAAINKFKSDGDLSAFNATVKQINTNFNTTDKTLKSAGASAETFGSKLTKVVGMAVGITSAMQAVMKLTQAMKELANTAIEVDDAMTQLQIVTGASDAQMESYASTIADTAQEVASTITDLTDSITTYSRLGYSFEDSSILAELTAMLQNVGDIDVSDAQDAITSITKAFDIDASDIEAKMDELVVVGNNFPISVSDLATGLNNASSALAAAGNTFEESVSLLTAANTTINLCRAA